VAPTSFAADHIEVLAQQLLARVLFDRIGLGREADDKGPVGARSNRGEGCRWCASSPVSSVRSSS